MTTYIQSQFNKVRDLTSAECETIQFTLQIAGPVGKTNHLNITIAQLNAIQKILEPVVTETKWVPKRFHTKKRADFLAKEYSKKYLTFWYVQEVHPGQFQPWAHDLDNGCSVSCFYCGEDWTSK